MYQAVFTSKLSGNGYFTKKCQHFFEERYGFKKCLLTTSGTDALEMCAMFCGLNPADEVIESNINMYLSMSKETRQRFQDMLLSHDLRGGRKRIMSLINGL